MVNDIIFILDVVDDVVVLSCWVLIGLFCCCFCFSSCQIKTKQNKPQQAGAAADDSLLPPPADSLEELVLMILYFWVFLKGFWGEFWDVLCKCRAVWWTAAWDRSWSGGEDVMIWKQTTSCTQRTDIRSDLTDFTVCVRFSSFFPTFSTELPPHLSVLL